MKPTGPKVPPSAGATETPWPKEMMGAIDDTVLFAWFVRCAKPRLSQRFADVVQILTSVGAFFISDDFTEDDYKKMAQTLRDAYVEVADRAEARKAVLPPVPPRVM